MGFWSSLGKIALKIAPVAAAFIPGVGIPLAMAISGATGAASSKISGASWKDALLSGGIDAGLAGVGGGLVKGLGPTASKLTKLGVNEAGQLGKNAINSSSQPSGQPQGNMATSNPSIFSNQSQPRPGTTPTSNPSVFGRTNPNANTVMPRGGYNFQNNPMNQMNQNTPNLAQSIFQGRQQAMKDQPFRAGYDVTWPGQIPPGSPAGTQVPMTTSRMPTIQSDINYGGPFSYDPNKQPPRRPRWNYAPPAPPSVDMGGDSGA